MGASRINSVCNFIIKCVDACGDGWWVMPSARLNLVCSILWLLMEAEVEMVFNEAQSESSCSWGIAKTNADSRFTGAAWQILRIFKVNCVNAFQFANFRLHCAPIRLRLRRWFIFSRFRHFTAGQRKQCIALNGLLPNDWNVIGKQLTPIGWCAARQWPTLYTGALCAVADYRIGQIQYLHTRTHRYCPWYDFSEKMISMAKYLLSS